MKKGFTLAEVLITLGIIGVVAAVTIPTLINNQKKKVLETQFKTAVSLVSQAVMQMGMDDSDLSFSYCGVDRVDQREHRFIQDFAKYFKVVKSDYGDTLDLRKLGYKQTNFSQSGPRSSLFNPDGHDSGAIILTNGMMIASSGCWFNTQLIDFIIDVNGHKKPNKLGYDVFYFQINKDGALLPFNGIYDFAYDEINLKNCCNFQNNDTCFIPTDTGVSCASFALRNQNPNDNTKTYWESLP